MILESVFSAASSARSKYDRFRLKRRLANLQAAGMRIGQGVNMPASTWIDASHAHLISIGDWCGFGEQCLILAHDAQMAEFLDVRKIDRVVLHESCHFGSRTVILPGVEVGPRTLVGANSVVSRSLPPDSVCAGAPAKVICTLDEYLERHRERMKASVEFPWEDYNPDVLTAARRAEIQAAVRDGPAYLRGGFSAELQGEGGTQRTPSNGDARPYGMKWLAARQRDASWRNT
jgi:maltose O-acetyltransferase